MRCPVRALFLLPALHCFSFLHLTSTVLSSCAVVSFHSCVPRKLRFFWAAFAAAALAEMYDVRGATIDVSPSLPSVTGYSYSSWCCSCCHIAHPCKSCSTNYLSSLAPLHPACRSVDHFCHTDDRPDVRLGQLTMPLCCRFAPGFVWHAQPPFASVIAS